MDDTTNLADLPSEPTNEGSGQNIVLQTNEKPTQYNPNVNLNNGETSTAINEQKTMNEFVTGIQQASAQGSTQLPSRDIPINTTQYTDEQVKPNYVPKTEHKDYIQNTDTDHDIMVKRMKHNSRDSLEILYDEFQIPIIIGLMFFIFQLPSVKAKFLTFLPSLHNIDGNPNLTGYILTSIFFSVCYYVISKSLNHLQSV